jgi:uncharacterized repeat protein (TIGR04138 family)
MPDIPKPKVSNLLDQDPRYKLEAYHFVREALDYADRVLSMGAVKPNQPNPGGDKPQPSQGDQHLTGQQLCEAIRLYALEQYGYMARCVLNQWGVHTTGDFGEIVYNLIRVGVLRKSKDDRREDFDDVYDFETAFEAGFRIERPRKK